MKIHCQVKKKSGSRKCQLSGHWTHATGLETKTQSFRIPTSRLLTLFSVADLEGGNRHLSPLIFNRLYFCIPFCIRMLTNEAQIARESFKKPRATRALKRALDPRAGWPEGTSGVAPVMCVRAHNLLRPPPMKILDPPPVFSSLNSLIMLINSFSFSHVFIFILFNIIHAKLCAYLYTIALCIKRKEIYFVIEHRYQTQN